MDLVANYWTWLGLSAGLLLIIYKHLRKLFYPCVTLSELKDALGCLETVYKEHDLISALHDDEYYELKITASKIVEKHLLGPALWTYVGFHPRLMPEIVRWYEQSEDVKRKILVEPTSRTNKVVGRLYGADDRLSNNHLRLSHTVTPRPMKAHFALLSTIVFIPLRLLLK
ncbi:hypothetical protein PQX77_006006, partial [Marasmius sp. AFHP31]